MLWPVPYRCFYLQQFALSHCWNVVLVLNSSEKNLCSTKIVKNRSIAISRFGLSSDLARFRRREKKPFYSVSAQLSWCRVGWWMPTKRWSVPLGGITWCRAWESMGGDGSCRDALLGGRGRRNIVDVTTRRTAAARRNTIISQTNSSSL